MEKRSLKAQAYTALRDRIIQGIYSPGQYLNENILIEELRLGRTPIKDALGRLEQEGLVIIKKKKGVVVSPLTLQDVNRIFEMRMLLEPYVLRTDGQRISADCLKHFYQTFSQLDLEKYSENQDIYYQLDADFHNAIVTASPNPFIHRCYQMVWTQSERFRFMTGSSSEKRISDTFQEHLHIVLPLLEGDQETAARELIIHLEASKEASIRLVMENAERLSLV